MKPIRQIRQIINKSRGKEIKEIELKQLGQYDNCDGTQGHLCELKWVDLRLEKEIDRCELKNGKYIATVAIEISTAFSGYVFTFAREPDYIYTGTYDGALQEDREPTSLLLNPDKSFNAFGVAAEDEYIRLSLIKKQGKYTFIKKPTFTLRDDCLVISDGSGKLIAARIVVAHIIRYLKEKALGVIDIKPNVSDRDLPIRWIITLPNESKDFRDMMKQAASDAGITTLSFISENIARIRYCKSFLKEANMFVALDFGESKVGVCTYLRAVQEDKTIQENGTIKVKKPIKENETTHEDEIVKVERFPMASSESKTVKEDETINADKTSKEKANLKEQETIRKDGAIKEKNTTNEEKTIYKDDANEAVTTFSVVSAKRKTTKKNETVNGEDTIKEQETIKKNETFKKHETIKEEETIKGEDTINGKDTIQGEDAINGKISIKGVETIKRKDTIKEENTIKGEDTVNKNETIKKDETLKDDENIKEKETINGEETIKGDETIKKQEHITKKESIKNDVTIKHNETIKKENETIKGEDTIKVQDTIEKNETIKKDETMNEYETIREEVTIKGEDIIKEQETINKKETFKKNESIKDDETIKQEETIKGEDAIKGKESLKGDHIKEKDHIKLKDHIKGEDTIKGENTVKKNESIKKDETLKDDETIKGKETIKEEKTIKGDETIKKHGHIKKNESIKTDETIKDAKIIKNDETIKERDIIEGQETIKNNIREDETIKVARFQVVPSAEKKFCNLLSKMFGGERWKNFMCTHAFDYLKLMQIFDERKRTFDTNTQNVCIRLPSSLLECKNSDEVDEQTVDEEFATVRVQNNSLILTHKAMADLFQPSLQTVVNLLQGVEKFDNLVLVGGVCECRYVRQVIKSQTNFKVIILAPSPRLGILKGAMY